MNHRTDAINLKKSPAQKLQYKRNHVTDNQRAIVETMIKVDTTKAECESCKNPERKSAKKQSTQVQSKKPNQ